MVFHQLVGTVRAQNVDLTTHISVVQQHDIARVRRTMSVGTCAWSRKPCDLALWGKETMPDAFLGGTIPGYLGKTVNLAKTQKRAKKTGKDRLMNFTMSSFLKKPLLDLQTQQVWQSFPQFSR